MALLQVGVDELYRRHERLNELRKRKRTEDEDREVKLLYDRTMPLLSSTGKKDLLALARVGERAMDQYLAWREDGHQQMELVFGLNANTQREEFNVQLRERP